jgi:hypothetical protein
MLQEPKKTLEANEVVPNPKLDNTDEGVVGVRNG